MGDGFDTVKANNDDTGADIIQIQGSGFYDLNWTWDDDHLYVGVSLDTNYDFNDVGGNVKIDNFRHGSDTVAYIEANLQADNTEWYTGSTAGPVRFYTTSGLNGIDQGAYTELLIGTSGNDVMTGNGGFFDYIFGQGGDDHLIGSDVTRDELRGGSDNYHLEGMSGNDRLAGEQGTDILDGGDGIDLARYDRNSGANGAYVNLSSSTRDGVASNTATDTHGDTDTLISIENIRGSNNNDTLIGSDGDNYLRGKDGDDILEGGLGDDLLQGDDGTDTAVFTGNFADYTITDDNGDVIVTANNGTDGTDRLKGVERLRFDDGLYDAVTRAPIADDQILTGDETANNLIGSAGNDTITGNGGDDTLTGNGGVDTLDGGTGADTYVHGIGDGHDIVVSSNDDGSVDTVRFKDGAYDLDWWRDGNDLVLSSASDDTYNSSVEGTITLKDHFVTGKDALDYFEADLDGTDNDGFYTDQSVNPGGIARVYTAGGLNGIDQGGYTELVLGTDGNDTITGGGGFRDYLNGGAGDDIITAGGGDDRLYGGTGNDTMSGGDGNDRFRGHDGTDSFDGGAGLDEVDYRRDAGQGGTANVYVDLEAGFAKDGFNDLDTFTSIEEARGTSQGDTLKGSSVANRLRGHDGDDIFEGRGGDDRLEGGSGNDTAIYSGLFSEYTITDDNGDVIVDGPDGIDRLTDIEVLQFDDGLYDAFTRLKLAADQVLTGDENSNSLTGDAGNDTLRGLGNTDFLDGGLGNHDVVDYSQDEAEGGVFGVQVNMHLGTAVDGFGSTDQIRNIEDAIGTSHSDTLNGSSSDNNLTGLDGHDTFAGNGGNDNIDGGTGRDTAIFAGNFAEYVFADDNGDVLVTGPAGIFSSTTKLTDVERLLFDDGYYDAFTRAPISVDADQLFIGDANANTLVGGTGYDTFFGQGGDDTLEGGVGADTYVWAVGDGFDTIKANNDDAGEDVIQIQGTGFYDLNWTWDDDHLYVGVSNDTNYDFNDVGGSVKIENFRHGSDSVAYLEAYLQADNTEWYTGSTTGAVRFYTTSGLIGIDQGAYTELLIGTSGNDEMRGNGGFFDYIFGQGGDDHLIGSDGTRDELRGGSDNDHLEGMSGNDRLAGEQGTDILDGGDGVDLARYDRNSGGNGAYVNLSSSTRDGVASNTATDTHGDTDTLISIENVRGSNNNDTLIGSDGDNYLRGKDGDDILEGGLGDDLLQGDGGTDTAVFTGNFADYTITDDNGDVIVTANNGTDGEDRLKDVERLQFDDGLYDAFTRLPITGGQVIVGDANANNLVGGAENDTITANGGDDILTGNGGDDILIGGAGADTYIWAQGDGFDTVKADDDDTGADTILIQGTGFYDLNWTWDDDHLYVGVAADDNFDFNDVGGNIKLENFRHGSDSVAYVEANLQADNAEWYTGSTEGTVRLYTTSGLNGVDQGAYTELLIGTSGNDEMRGNGGFFDYIFGQGGDDHLIGTDGTRDELRGGTENDHLEGMSGNDRLAGEQGNDILDGGDGVDLARYDRNSGANGAYVNLSSVTRDGVLANTATDTHGDTDTLISIEDVRGSNNNDTVIGSDGNNYIRGKNGDDILEGGAGNDRLHGEGDNDTLRGGEGDDELKGGSGNDIIFTGNSNYYEGDTVIAGSGNDIIDFETGQGYYTLYYGDLGGPVIFNLSNSVNATIPAFTIDKGADGADTLFNLDNINSDDGGLGVIGTGGDDTYIGQNNANSWTQIRLGAGNDTITGGVGQERLDYSDALVGVTVDFTSGQTSEDGFGTFDIFSAIEEVRGSDYADRLTGSEGDERFIGRNGDDIIDGQGGFDTARYDRSSVDSVDVDLEAGTATGTWNGSAFTHTLINIEAIRGSNNADTIRGDSLDNYLRGKSGDDILIGRAGSDDFRGDGGADTFDFTGQNVGTDIDAVEDYNYGDGDILNISDLITFTDGTGDVVGDFVRATVSGSDLSLEVSTDNGVSFTQVAVLDGISAVDTLRVILDNDEMDLIVS
ncbi:type I secretion C-terminal target domain-containing protein [Kiloniella sp.]|uniref:type I secretion C-terminal target domain-containing protein n=1 Tax=Kiloniella sp. TaxID=1938587 RepID=UPI003B01B86F